MLLVLTLAVSLLVVSPLLLLWLGRLIANNTDGRTASAQAMRGLAVPSNRAPAAADPNRVPWFKQPMKPAFAPPKKASWRDAA